MVPCNESSLPFVIPHGIPTIADYHRLLATDAFHEMETFAETFSRTFHFSKECSWVKDPFHQWSRQWEYLHAWQNICSGRRENRSIVYNVLDAGSGITFFPFYIRKNLPAAVSCCDRDVNLGRCFSQINALLPAAERIQSSRADLAQLPYTAASFDTVYCLSVLEHTRQYGAIAQEFARVLKPGGRLVLSFDIGLDGVSEMSAANMASLMGAMGKHFDNVPRPEDIKSRLDPATTVTTSYVHGIDPQAIPWKFPRLSLIKSALASRRLPRGLMKNLTFYCNVFTKAAK